MKKRPSLFLVAAIAFYIIGALFINKENSNGIVYEREKYTYVGYDGEEHEDESFLDMPGIGKVLTYKDVYYASAPMFLIAIIIGSIVFKGGVKTSSKASLQHIVFANCILGVLLIWLTKKENVVSTIMFWMGIVAAFLPLLLFDNDL